MNLKFLKSTFDKDNDISKIKSNQFDLPLVNAKDGDNGIMYYGRSKDFECAEMTIDIVNDGAISTGNVYSQPQKTGVLYNAYLIKPKFIVNEKTLHFFTTSIYKSIKHKFGYENKAGWEKVKKERIWVPINNGNIDYEFIENIISDIEEVRVEELNSYLSVNGLNNYELSEKEKEAIKDYNSLKWGIFKLEKLFGKSTRGKRLKSQDRISGNLPFVTAGESDEGVSDFIGNQVNVFSNNTTTIDMFGSAKYRNYKYGGDDHIAVVHTDKLPNYASIFVTSAIHKASYNGQFNYGNNFYAKDADALNISLPINDEKPDYQTMVTLVSAVHKLVIKDLVLYVKRKQKIT